MAHSNSAVTTDNDVAQVLQYFNDLSKEHTMNTLMQQWESKNKRQAAKMRRGKQSSKDGCFDVDGECYRCASFFV